MRFLRIGVVVVTAAAVLISQLSLSLAFLLHPSLIKATIQLQAKTDPRIEGSRALNAKCGIKVGIAGAGSVAFGTAALLVREGNDPMLWSPSGSGTFELLCDDNIISATGAIDICFSPRIATSAKTLVNENDVILIALPAYGHKRVMDEIAPYIREGQHIIISSHASLGALYLSQQLQKRRNNGAPFVPITAWGTTVVTARQKSGRDVQVNTIRKLVDLCTVPSDQSDMAQELCRNLFNSGIHNSHGNLRSNEIEFRPRDGLLAISLSNLNPQNHLGIALGNMSRMEKGEEESWYQCLNITPNIGRFLEALDKERLDIANALGYEVRTIFDHFSLSFHVPKASSISDMNMKIHEIGNDVFGPSEANSRYVTEDAPILALTVVLGKLVGKEANLHESGLNVISAMYGRDFANENDLLKALDIERYSLDDLKEAAYSGFLTQKQNSGHLNDAVH